MPRRFADFIKIVMFAARAETFLRTDGSRIIAPFVAEKNVFKLIHSRVDEQKRRIVGGQQAVKNELAYVRFFQNTLKISV